MTARRAAEAARAEAVKQQMAAAAAAKAATDAAAKEVRVTYDDNGKATVSVGDTKIVAGSPKVTTTTEGKKVETGKAGDLAENSREYRQESKEYDAGPPATYQTGINGRVIPYGSYTDSEMADSKQSRLWLVDKYIATTTVNGYRRQVDGSSNAVTVNAPITAKNPDGSVDGKRIMRAEGEFYVLDTETDTDFTTADYHDVINSNTPDTNAGVGVYYYMDGSDKKYLIRTGTSGTTQFVYQRIFVFDVPNFPVAKAYEHMNFGMWNKKSDRTELGTAFVAALPGGEGMTPAGDMPNFGKATYKGHAVWQRRAQHAEGKGGIGGYEGTATTTADFSKNTIRTDLFDAHWFYDNADGHNGIVASLHGKIDGNGFSGNRVTNVNNEGEGYDTPGFYAGGEATHRGQVGIAPSADGSLYQVKEYRGNFFGANAEEVGGVFHITSEGKKNGELQGSFGGRRGDIE